MWSTHQRYISNVSGLYPYFYFLSPVTLRPLLDESGIANLFCSVTSSEPLFLSFFVLFRKYNAITALEQRQQYKEDFCAEYDEYRVLHDRIGAITEMFVQLGSKINTLSPGTQEYKVLLRSFRSLRCHPATAPVWNVALKLFPLFSFLPAHGGPNSTKV